MASQWGFSTTVCWIKSRVGIGLCDIWNIYFYIKGKLLVAAAEKSFSNLVNLCRIIHKRARRAGILKSVDRLFPAFRKL